MTLSGPEIVRQASRYDTQIWMIAAVRHYHREVGSILYVGGENFGLITFNEEGDYERYRSNTSCAAGTGSFLDQQAQRLNLKSIDILSTIAFCNQENAPRIATRCAVFAKTDLTHAQQEGYSIAQISDGLCEGLAKNVIDTLMPDQHIQDAANPGGRCFHEPGSGQAFQQPAENRTGYRRIQPSLRRYRRCLALSGRNGATPAYLAELG